MKVMIDTNILLDVLCNRPQFVEDSLKIYKLCEVKQIDGCISALSIPNIVYILRKELNPAKVNEIVTKLSLIFTIVDLKADDIRKAAALGFADFEDALQSVCAKRIRATYIVTRNVKDYVNGAVMAIKPSELLERL